MSELIKETAPLRIERFGKDGWFFVSCDKMPGLSSFGPDLGSVLKGLETAGADLLRRRGMNILFVTIEPMTEDEEQDDASVDWGTVDKYALCHQVAL